MQVGLLSVFATLMLGYFFMVADFLIVIPAFARIAEELGQPLGAGFLIRDPHFEIALMYGLYFVGQGVFTLYLGALSDWLGRKKLILCSLLGMASSYFLSWIALVEGSLILFAFSRFFCGALGAYRSLVFTVFSDACPEPSHRVRFFGIFSVVDAFLWFIFFLIAAKVITPDSSEFLGGSIKLPFLLAGFVLALTAALVWINFQERFRPERAGGWLLSLRSYGPLFAKREVVKVYFLFFAFFALIGSLIHIHRSRSVAFVEAPAWALTTCYALFAILWSIASSLLLPKFIKRFDSRAMACIGFSLLAVLWLAVPFAPNILSYMILILLFGSAVGFLWPLSFFLVSIQCGVADQGKAQAVTLSIYSFVALWSAYFPFSAHIGWVQTCMVALAIVSALLSFTLNKKEV